MTGATPWALFLILCALILQTGTVLGAQTGVTVTAASGGTNISADTAANGAAAAYTTLGDIVITETQAGDFNPGTGTLILTAPSGWQFRSPGTASVSFAPSANITSASIAVSSSTATVTVSVSAANKTDTLTIHGLEVQATEGGNLPASGTILRTAANPGTATITGIVNDTTSFGSLSQAIGTRKIFVVLPNQAFTDAATLSGSGITGTPTAQVSGVAFNLSKLVVADREFNIDSTYSGAKTISYSGPGGSPTYTTSVSFTSGQSTTTLATTLTQAQTTTITATDGTVAGVASSSLTVNTGGLHHFAISAIGSQTAGTPFSITVTAQDIGNNTVTSFNGTVNLATTAGTISPTTSGAFVNGVRTQSVSVSQAGSGKTISATDAGASGATGTSASFTVAPGAASALVVSGFTSPATAGNAGSVTVTAKDASGNVATGYTGTIHFTSGDAQAVLPADYTFTGGDAGVHTFTGAATLKTAGSQSITATDTVNGALNNSQSVTVNPAAASKLTIQTQPSSTATAGVAFGTQPVIRIEDAFGNLRSSDSSTVVTAARGTGTGTLQGTLTATASSGVASFTGLSYLVAEPMSVNFSSGSLTGASSSTVTVSPAALAALQLLVPGETAAPGTLTGKTGTPDAQHAGLAFPVTVNAVDAFGNLVSSGTDTVHFTSSDAAATLPSDVALVAGTGTANVTLNTTGSATITASDASNNAITASDSPSITVEPPVLTPANASISADTAAPSTSWTTLTGPVYTEPAAGAVGTGTIILDAPAGFEFDTGGIAPTVRVDGDADSSKNINGASNGSSESVTSVTANQVTFTIASSSSAPGTPNTLTWENVRVRPTAGTPLANGNILNSTGTATLTGVSSNSIWGTLTELAGASTKLAFTTGAFTGGNALSAGVTSGTLTVERRDQFNNPNTSEADLLLNLTSDSPGTHSFRDAANAATTISTVTIPQGSSTAAFGYYDEVAGSPTVTAADQSGQPDTGLTDATQQEQVTANAANRLVFTVQPAGAVAGYSFTTQPVVKTQDAFGNDSTTGLSSSQMLTLTLSAGTGSLQGATPLDIGTAAGNGTVTFSGLRLDAVGTGKQLTAAASGLTSGTSSTFAVINHPPVTGNDSLSRPSGKTVKVLASTLLANDTDPDGHALTISSVASPSSNGATILFDGTWVIYLPPAGFNSTDTFTYTASDAFGGSTPATVTVNVPTPDTAQTQNILGVSPSGSDFIVHFVGIPGRSYTVQYTTDLANPSWTTLGTQVAGPNGLFDYQDVAPGGPNRFYRTTTAP